MGIIDTGKYIFQSVCVIPDTRDKYATWEMWGLRDKDIPMFRVVCVSLRTRNQHCRLVQLLQFNCPMSIYLTGKTNTFEGICLLYSCGCEWMLVCRQKGICCIWIGAELEREQFLYYVFNTCHGNIGVSKNTPPHSPPYALVVSTTFTKQNGRKLYNTSFLEN